MTTENELQRTSYAKCKAGSAVANGIIFLPIAPLISHGFSRARRRIAVDGRARGDATAVGWRADTDSRG